MRSTTFKKTVGWENSYRLQVRFPDTSNTLSVPDGIVHLTLDHQEDQDAILRIYAYFASISIIQSATSDTAGL